MGPDNFPVPRAIDAPALPGGEPKAAAHGALATLPVAGTGALLTYLLFATGLLAFHHPFTLAVAGLVTPVFLGIPAARLAARVTRKKAKRSSREAAAAAAGAGFMATAVAAGSIALIPASMVEVGLLAPVILGAAAAVGLVGARAFSEVPDEETPGLYLGLLSSGLSGAHLAFWGAILGGTIGTLVPDLMSHVIGASAPGLFPIFAMAAVGMGLLAPVSFATARIVGRARSKTGFGWLLSGVAAPLLVPGAVASAIAVTLSGFHVAIYGAVWAAAASGLILAIAPHMLAIYLGLRLGRRAAEAQQLPAGRALPAGEGA